jgi:hypothetical protein
VVDDHIEVAVELQVLEAVVEHEDVGLISYRILVSIFPDDHFNLR